MSRRIVVALGGNALGNTPSEQKTAVLSAAVIMADLVASGNTIVIGHGNGPQVGMINLAMGAAAETTVATPAMPLAECGAMSQGYIGYHLQQALQKALDDRKLGKNAVTLITQVEIDPDDPAFAHPSKPVGRFYDKKEAKSLHAKRGFEFVEDSGRGWRRVVPSPLPQRIVELQTVKALSENGTVVITVGGGGIPVVARPHGLEGIDAVIDKDMSCSKLARELEADVLLILTAVDCVSINYNLPTQQALSAMTTSEALHYIEEEQFAPGSMLPKVKACLNFLEGHPERSAIIGSLDKAADALAGTSGTRITLG